jgi:hypothetical protein
LWIFFTEQEETNFFYGVSILPDFENKLLKEFWNTIWITSR